MHLAEQDHFQHAHHTATAAEPAATSSILCPGCGPGVIGDAEARSGREAEPWLASWAADAMGVATAGAALLKAGASTRCEAVIGLAAGLLLTLGVLLLLGSLLLSPAAAISDLPLGSPMGLEEDWDLKGTESLGSRWVSRAVGGCFQSRMPRPAAMVK